MMLDNLLTDAQNELFCLLVEAGVGPRSPRMQELLAARLDPAHVRAHIEAWQREIDNGKPHTVGLLITRLLDRDPTPAAEKFAKKCRCMQCPACRRHLQKEVYDKYPWIQH